ncbi:Ketosamine-3-kinase [Microthyrium microscopicum]|uniref:protein-ribulosamine 3-kinase n=1 Tax=Microthyrium microscopicum TaxID=703497 RepID=A0A6A6UU28_9PEZI|nr:Ketosamine-3-kinase [Microthyrium microscopicum]
MKLDSAVAQVLGINPDHAIVSSSGGGGCSSASTAKITVRGGNDHGADQLYFLKTAKGPDAEIMFRGEHASLTAIHDQVPTLCPNSYGWGRFESSSSTYFLVTDHLNLGARSPVSGETLAAKLAKLHSTPAPIPKGYSKAMFGFPEITCCGDTPQTNNFSESWADFYANHRLRSIRTRSEKSNGSDAELSNLIEITAAHVVPRLLGDGHLGGSSGIVPVVVHGDLWSGNAGTGSLGLDGPVEQVVYDPSAVYGHNEYELGIMKMFGGFGGQFLKEYHELCPKTAPVEEYSDRVALYELYHHLNHHVCVPKPRSLILSPKSPAKPHVLF